MSIKVASLPLSDQASFSQLAKSQSLCSQKPKLSVTLLALPSTAAPLCFHYPICSCHLFPFLLLSAKFFRDPSQAPPQADSNKLLPK